MFSRGLYTGTPPRPELERAFPSLSLTRATKGRQTVGWMPQPAHRSPHRVVHLRVDAPPKPPTGQPCNGCGVCCAWAPCPAGMLVSRRRRGRCRALRWTAGQYRCDLLARPERHLRWLPARWAEWLARRWIAAGRGCDADLLAG